MSRLHVASKEACSNKRKVKRKTRHNEPHIQASKTAAVENHQLEIVCRDRNLFFGSGPHCAQQDSASTKGKYLTSRKLCPMESFPHDKDTPYTGTTLHYRGARRQCIDDVISQLRLKRQKSVFLTSHRRSIGYYNVMAAS
ncbi:unnamed protein product [Clavelina lepadiformis]|uniref:Uncharacterized protein n=1 Tax=Clavelina lepadiformis TaxID=159417 RepID=A0ABP0F913_CLALP